MPNSEKRKRYCFCRVKRGDARGGIEILFCIIVETTRDHTAHTAGMGDHLISCPCLGRNCQSSFKLVYLSDPILGIPEECYKTTSRHFNHQPQKRHLCDAVTRKCRLDVASTSQTTYWPPYRREIPDLKDFDVKEGGSMS